MASISMFNNIRIAKKSKQKQKSQTKEEEN
jgi:hypothetical protein